MLLCRTAAFPEGELRASRAFVAAAPGLTRGQAACLVNSLVSRGELARRPSWRESVYRVTPKGLGRLACMLDARAGGDARQSGL